MFAFIFNIYLEELIFMYDIIILFLLFIIYSFLGWIIETAACSIYYKIVADRGFLIGPICPIYGVSALFMIIVLKRYNKDVIVLFAMAFLLCSILEYITSYIMEKLFKTRWWDYSNRVLNVNGRVCLRNSFCFGILGVLLLYYINPFVLDILYKIPALYLNISALILFIIFVTDYIVSFFIISKFTKKVTLIKKDSSNEINSKIRQELLSFKFHRRLIRAFPRINIKK